MRCVHVAEFEHVPFSFSIAESEPVSVTESEPVSKRHAVSQ